MNSWRIVEWKQKYDITIQLLFPGIRIFGDDEDDPTDAMEALAFQHNRQHLDIYSCSWGPEDTGWTMDGPEKLTRDQLEEGAKKVSV